jgi:hypothetical protein
MKRLFSQASGLFAAVYYLLRLRLLPNSKPAIDQARYRANGVQMAQPTFLLFLIALQRKLSRQLTNCFETIVFAPFRAAARKLQYRLRSRSSMQVSRKWTATPKLDDRFHEPDHGTGD